MKKGIISFICVLLMSSTSFSQDYKTAIGLKGGFPGFGAINVKHYLSGRTAIDASLGGGSHHLWLQGLFEINNPIQNGLGWYYGVGADLGFWSGNYYYYNKRHDKYYNGAWGGVDGVIGLEYTFQEIPLNLALEAVPTVRVFPYVGFAMNGAFAVRFTLK